MSAKYRVILFSFTIFVNQLGGLTKQVQNYKPDVCNPQTLSKVSFITFFYESVRKVLIPWHHATQLYFGTIIKLPFFFLRKYKPQILRASVEAATPQFPLSSAPMLRCLIPCTSTTVDTNLFFYVASSFYFYYILMFHC